MLIPLREGAQIDLNDIVDPNEGEEILDELHGSIISIEEQLCFNADSKDRTWRIRAQTALRHRKLMVPRLQARIAMLRRQRTQDRAVARRDAFVLAAKEELDLDTYERLWDVARTNHPEAFS